MQGFAALGETRVMRWVSLRLPLRDLGRAGSAGDVRMSSPGAMALSGRARVPTGRPRARSAARRRVKRVGQPEKALLRARGKARCPLNDSRDASRRGASRAPARGGELGCVPAAHATWTRHACVSGTSHPAQETQRDSQRHPPIHAGFAEDSEPLHDRLAFGSRRADCRLTRSAFGLAATTCSPFGLTSRNALHTRDPGTPVTDLESREPSPENRVTGTASRDGPGPTPLPRCC